MAYFRSVEDMIAALEDVGYTEDEIDYIFGEGWLKFQETELYRFDMSPSHYIIRWIDARTE